MPKYVKYEEMFYEVKDLYGQEMWREVRSFPCDQDVHGEKGCWLVSDDIPERIRKDSKPIQPTIW